MRKVVLILTAVLIVIFLILSILGKDTEYDAEKLLFTAAKRYETILSNPDVIPPHIISSVESTLKKVMQNYPETKSAHKAYLRLMELYYADKKYDAAIAAADEVMQKYSYSTISVSKALFLKASCYKEKGEWNKALSELAILKRKYINTSLGLQVPIYIANYYKNKGDQQKAQKAFTEAISFYGNLKDNYTGTPLGYVSANILVQIHITLENYEEAGKVIKENVSDYPSTTTLAQQMAFVDLVFVKTLKRPEEALEIYERIKETTESSRLKEFLQTKIDELETSPKAEETSM